MPTISVARNFTRFFAVILLSFDLSKFVSGPRSDESLTIRFPDSRDSCALLSCLRGSGIRKCEEGFKEPRTAGGEQRATRATPKSTFRCSHGLVTFH